MKLFGSGWVWLVDNDGFIEIMPSPNSGNLRSATERLTSDALGTPTGLRAMEPALCINLWERAYYTDFKDDKEVFNIIEGYGYYHE